MTKIIKKTPALQQSRRDFLVNSAVVAGATMFMPLMSGKAIAASETVVVGDGGGPYTPAFAKVFHQPFRAATHINSVQVARTSVEAQAIAQVKAQVETGAFQWDLVTFGSASAVQLDNLGFLEPIRKPGLDYHENDLMPGAMSDTFLGVYYSGLIFAYRKSAFPVGKEPKTWADFWDAEKFPGKRGVFKSGLDLMEPAVLSANIAKEDIYPIDVELAFSQLDKLKPHVRTWFDSLAASTQALLDGSLDLVMTFSSRASAAIAQGAPVNIAWDQWLAQPVGFVIPKGAPHADNARLFLSQMSDPKAQALLAEAVNVGPTNVKAYEYIDPKIRDSLPGSPATRNGMVNVNGEWRSENNAVIVERFARWIES